jgi:hypothetical protein
MLLRYAEKHKIKAFVHHKDRLVERYVPEGANGRTAILNWAVIGHHCLFYAGQNANMATAKSEVREVRANLRSGDMDIADYYEECSFHYADKTRAPCFREPTKLPPFEEWESGFDIIPQLEQGAAEGDRPTKKARRTETCVYYEYGGQMFGTCVRSLRER